MSTNMRQQKHNMTAQGPPRRRLPAGATAPFGGGAGAGGVVAEFKHHHQLPQQQKKQPAPKRNSTQEIPARAATPGTNDRRKSDPGVHQPGAVPSAFAAIAQYRTNFASAKDNQSMSSSERRRRALEPPGKSTTATAVESAAMANARRKIRYKGNAPPNAALVKKAVSDQLTKPAEETMINPKTGKKLRRVKKPLKQVQVVDNDDATQISNLTTPAVLVKAAQQLEREQRDMQQQQQQPLWDSDEEESSVGWSTGDEESTLGLPSIPETATSAVTKDPPASRYSSVLNDIIQESQMEDENDGDGSESEVYESSVVHSHNIGNEIPEQPRVAETKAQPEMSMAMTTKPSRPERIPPSSAYPPKSKPKHAKPPKEDKKQKKKEAKAAAKVAKGDKQKRRGTIDQVDEPTRPVEMEHDIDGNAIDDDNDNDRDLEDIAQQSRSTLSMKATIPRTQRRLWPLLAICLVLLLAAGGSVAWYFLESSK